MAFEKVRLADCCIIKPPKSEAKKLLSSDDNVSFVPMNNLGIDNKFLTLDANKKLSEVSGSYTYFSENDVLLAKITPCFENGKLGIATGLTNGVGIGSSEFIVFRSKGGVYPNYLYYYLLQPSFRESGQKVMTGAVGHKRVPKDFIENTKIPLPSILEQKRIVAILDQAFADIEQARAKTEQNLKNARELFESYLQQVFNQSGEGWVETTLGNLSDINYGYTEKASFEANGPHFLRITDIQNNDVNWGKVPYCPISKADYAKHKLETGDIVFARTGATTGKSYLLSNPPEAVAASYLIRLRVKSDALLPEFVKFFFQTKGYWDVVNAGMTGSAQGGFNASKLAAMEITYPDCRDTQRVFVDKLSLVAQEIEQIISKYEKKLVVLDELKKSILQKAFSGKLTKTLEVDTNKRAVA
jgi:type I restriction enzyme S subunit